MNWTILSATIEPTAAEDFDEDGDGEDDEPKNDPLVVYLRHLWVMTHGETKGRELAAEIRMEITSEAKTLQFLSEARDVAVDYIALSSSKHPKWQKYPPTTKHYVDTISEHLRVKQIKPLLFAIARHFDPVEADKAFKLCVSWSARFLVFGGRGGMLDKQYSQRAKEVGTREITKARDLREAMKRYVPTDPEFEEAFAGARVSRPYLARYYLRALEKKRKGLAQPEYVPNEEVSDISLEHVMPLQPSSEWQVDSELAQAAQKFLGNMALIKATQNGELGNAGFEKKRKVYARSGYLLTKEIAQFENWTLTEIKARQKEMAKLAVATWSLDFAD